MCLQLKVSLEMCQKMTSLDLRIALNRYSDKKGQGREPIIRYGSGSEYRYRRMENATRYISMIMPPNFIHFRQKIGFKVSLELFLHCASISE